MKVVKCITHMMYGRTKGDSQFHKFTETFVHRWHLTMQGLRTFLTWSYTDKSKEKINCD